MVTVQSSLNGVCLEEELRLEASHGSVFWLPIGTRQLFGALRRDTLVFIGDLLSFIMALRRTVREIMACHCQCNVDVSFSPGCVAHSVCATAPNTISVRKMICVFKDCRFMNYGTCGPLCGKPVDETNMRAVGLDIVWERRYCGTSSADVRL